ncbi:MAG: YkgJ family cysteine cluster protein [Candidatus Hermodarchaeota archaeon]
MKNLRFACIRCGNCCTDKNTLVNLTYLDIVRIKNGLNLDINEVLDFLGFFVFSDKTNNVNKKKMVIEPIATEKGPAYIALLKNSLGGCYFYNSEKRKCLIYKLRPNFCRTFPFSFKILDESKSDSESLINIFYTEKGKEFCPGIRNNAPLIDIDYWIRIGKKTLEELESNQKLIRKWNELVKNGKVYPTVKKFLLMVFELNK